MKKIVFGLIVACTGILNAVKIDFARNLSQNSVIIRSKKDPSRESEISGLGIVNLNLPGEAVVEYGPEGARMTQDLQDKNYLALTITEDGSAHLEQKDVGVVEANLPRLRERLINKETK